MPQLMPLYWIFSVFMILFILVMTMIMYNYKNLEKLNNILFKNEKLFSFNMLW